MLKEILASDDFLSCISEAVEKKLGHMIDKINKQENLIKQLESDTKTNSKLLSKLNDDMTDNHQRLLTRCEKLESTIMDLENERDRRTQHITRLQTQLEAKEDSLQHLTNDMNSLHQYSRRNCLRIFGLKPETPNESTDEIIMDVAKKIGVSINTGDIDRSHQVGSAPTDKKKGRAVIVKFCSYKKRELFIRSRKKLKGTGQSIHEDLTPRNSGLLHEAQKVDIVTSAWSMDGRIFVAVTGDNGKSKKHLIRSADDLRKLDKK